MATGACSLGQGQRSPPATMHLQHALVCVSNKILSIFPHCRLFFSTLTAFTSCLTFKLVKTEKKFLGSKSFESKPNRKLDSACSFILCCHCALCDCYGTSTWPQASWLQERRQLNTFDINSFTKSSPCDPLKYICHYFICGFFLWFI